MRLTIFVYTKLYNLPGPTNQIVIGSSSGRLSIVYQELFDSLSAFQRGGRVTIIPPGPSRTYNSMLNRGTYAFGQYLQIITTNISFHALRGTGGFYGVETGYRPDDGMWLIRPMRPIRMTDMGWQYVD